LQTLKSSEDQIWEDQLDALAADPDIQREIGLIEIEFASTEADGLDEDL
jgi:hypothetical protein